jgi:hypothetical protein
LVHQNPRKFGKRTSLRTLEMAALVSFEEGLTKERITGETVRATLFCAQIGSALGAGQTLDHFTRSGVCNKEGGATD